MQAYVGNAITQEELDELTKIVADPSSEKLIQEFMERHWMAMKVDDNLKIDHEGVFDRILVDRSSEDAQLVPEKIRLYRWATLRYAASIVVLFAVGLTFYLSRNGSKQMELSEIPNKISKSSLKNIDRQPFLTLSDGTMIPLDSNLTANSVYQGFSNFTNRNGQLVYHHIEGASGSKIVADMNTVTTPKGGEYQITLVDGTKVWLNTASSITYPVTFNTNQRRVKIQGEAYLEVAKNPSVPFIVEANGIEVVVLGTHFNVSAYPDDNFIKTTLVEGAVKLTSQNASRLLSPGQQGDISRNSGKIKVANVNVADVLAWRNGYFVFKGEDIKSIMRIISRWYDVEIIYQGDLKGRTFSGTLSRFGSMEEMLRTIELTDAVHFDIKERRVIVMP